MGIYQTHSGSGDNIAGDKIVYERKLFSNTQSIRVLPPSLGGNDTLLLDGAAVLKLHLPYSLEAVTLLLDVVPTYLTDQITPSMRVEGLNHYDHTSGSVYVFDARDGRRHEIAIAGRSFVVTLLKISQLQVSGVSHAIEYQFGISEQDNGFPGGRGGTASASGRKSSAIGGKGGAGGPYGKGGDGGNAEAHGDGVFALGGEGGEAGQIDRGGKGGRGPLHVLMEDHPEKYQELQSIFEFTDEEVKRIGRGGDGGFVPESSR